MSAIKVRSRLCALVVAVVATAAPVTAPFMIHVLSWITHGSLLTILRFPAVIAQEIAPALSLSSQLRLVAIGGIASALPPCRGRVYWFATCSGAPSHCLSYAQDKASWRSD